MEEVVCTACGLSWNSRNGKHWLAIHGCLGSAEPSLEELLTYLAPVRDAYGCLVPTRHVKKVSPSREHWWLDLGARRVIGESYAHRAVLSLKIGHRIESTLLAAHECKAPNYENGSCINPEHLFERTKQENTLWIEPERRKRPQARSKHTETAKANMRAAWELRKNRANDNG